MGIPGFILVALTFLLDAALIGAVVGMAAYALIKNQPQAQKLSRRLALICAAIFAVLLVAMYTVNGP